MSTLEAGCWGGYFGTVGLMLAAALLALVRALPRVAATAAVTALLSALFAVSFLGWLPLAQPFGPARVQAHIAVLCATVLGLMLFTSMGLMRDAAAAARIKLALAFSAAGVLLAGWMGTPMAALVLGALMALGVGCCALVCCVGRALQGHRLAWFNVCGIGFMVLMIAGLSWIALDRGRVAWQVHAVSAVAGMAYLATITGSLWERYSYLIELREIMSHGPSYDPVTRLRSHAETGLMLGDAFARRAGDTRSVGVIVVTVGNLYALERLHGHAAINHALFVCAGRLRRSVPASAEMGRLSEDGFLVLLRDAAERNLERVAREIAAALGRPMALGTSRDPGELDIARTAWVADVGVGLMRAPPEMRPAAAVARSRAMSRTALSYPSRVAWHDSVAGCIAELPEPGSRPVPTDAGKIITGF